MSVEEFPVVRMLLVYLILGFIRMLVRVCQSSQYPLRKRWAANLYGWPYYVLDDIFSWLQWRRIMQLPTEDVNGVMSVLGARTFSCAHNTQTGEYVFSLGWPNGHEVVVTMEKEAMEITTEPGYHVRAVAWYMLCSPKERV